MKPRPNPQPYTSEDCRTWKQVTSRWSSHSGRRTQMRMAYQAADRRDADLMFRARRDSPGRRGWLVRLDVEHGWQHWAGPILSSQAINWRAASITYFA